MTCDKCDPYKQYITKGVENIIISIPAIQLQNNETYELEIKICKYCKQKFSVPKYVYKS